MHQQTNKQTSKQASQQKQKLGWMSQRASEWMEMLDKNVECDSMRDGSVPRVWKNDTHRERMRRVTSLAPLRGLPAASGRFHPSTSPGRNLSGAYLFAITQPSIQQPLAFLLNYISLSLLFFCKDFISCFFFSCFFFCFFFCFLFCFLFCFFSCFASSLELCSLLGKEKGSVEWNKNKVTRNLNLSFWRRVGLNVSC